MEKIPCLDLKRQHVSLKNELFEVFEKVYDQTSFSGGPFVEEFENSFKAFIGANFCVGVSNGTVALQLALEALGIGRGDEVIVPANTFIATAWGVSHVGATPVFVDCDATWTIDPAKIEAAITPKTKAVIGVHLYGQPFDIDAVQAICNKHQIDLVEDAAQAQGAEYKGKRVGTFGKLACFSFYPGKNLGACGEAGGITGNDPVLEDKLRMLRNHGSKKRYYHEVIGYNYRMGGFEGASLYVKMNYLENWNKNRQAIAAYYRSKIQNKHLIFQNQPSNVTSVNHLFVVMVENREHFAEYLEENGIIPAYHYPVPCHLQDAYKYLNYQIGAMPQAEKLASGCVSLPMFPELTQEEVDKVVMVVNNYKV